MNINSINTSKLFQTDFDSVVNWQLDEQPYSRLASRERVYYDTKYHRVVVNVSPLVKVSAKLADALNYYRFTKITARELTTLDNCPIVGRFLRYGIIYEDWMIKLLPYDVNYINDDIVHKMGGLGWIDIPNHRLKQLYRLTSQSYLV